MAVQIALSEKFACFAFKDYSLAASAVAPPDLSHACMTVRDLRCV
jgi:hypothetical protein